MNSDASAALAAYLAANPGKTARDYKGKDTAPIAAYPAGPRELPFDRLDRDHVRYRADGVPARLLPRNVRQAAARDPGMVWDEAARAYRLASPRMAGEGCAIPVQYLDSVDPRASAPAPAPAGLGSGRGEGASESLAAASLTTGANQSREC